MTLSFPVTPNLYQHLKPYFVMAEYEAKKSECARRQYGAAIAYPSLSFDLSDVVLGYNKRIGKCCSGDICVRTRLNVQHGQAVEKGGEIHAETAALINNTRPTSTGKFILVGFAGQRQLYEKDSLPCHSCAMNIKHAGFTYIHILSAPDTMSTVSVSSIIEYREQEWEPSD